MFSAVARALAATLTIDGTGKLRFLLSNPNRSNPDDVVGYRYALIVEQSFADEAAVVALGNGDGDVAVIVAEGALADWLKRLGERTIAVLVRPDRYVAGVATDAAGLQRLVATRGSP